MRKRKRQSFHSIFATTYNKLMKAWKPKKKRRATSSDTLTIEHFNRGYEALMRNEVSYSNLTNYPAWQVPVSQHDLQFYGGAYDLAMTQRQFLGLRSNELSNDHEEESKPDINSLYSYYKKQ